MAEQSHRADPRILGRRTLERDHRTLAALLRQGLSVLDVGCGTGAITSGIARAVGPAGRVVGVDRDEGLLEIARTEHADVPNLRFGAGDAARLSYRAEFDIVTAARILQWIAAPGMALARMAEAAKPGGTVVALDYNHTHNTWEPEPPAAFRQFYRAFLAWRDVNGWDNDIASHLPDLFRAAGLTQVETRVEDDIIARGDPGFGARSGMWSEVIDSLGGQLVEDGYSTTSELLEARRSFSSWASTECVRQVLEMRCVIGRVSPAPEYSPDPAAA